MIDEHQVEMEWKRTQSKLLHNIYDTFCVIEQDIINKKIELACFNDVIQNSQSLIEQFNQIPNCLLIKTMQIIQLLLQLNQPILDDIIKKLQQVVKKYENDFKQLNLFQNNESYEISKAYIFDYEVDLRYIALSPNEKYLLIGTSNQVSVYDIEPKLNIKIYKEKWTNGLFSQNSIQIILVVYNRIIIININTGKKQQYRCEGHIIGNCCFINQNYLYFTVSSNSYLQGSRIIKIQLKSNCQIFSYNTPEHQSKLEFFEDLITLQSYDYFQIINENKRKLGLKLKLSEYKLQELFLINKNEILSLDVSCQLIIWNIDYQNNSILKNKVLPFCAQALQKSNLYFGYFYILSFDVLEIIDDNYNTIYRNTKKDNQYYKLFRSSHQLNSEKMFVIFQEDGIFILERHKQG